MSNFERVLEERLREKVCLGDIEAVQDLLNLGVDVNAPEPVSGWYLLFQLCFHSFTDRTHKNTFTHLFLNFFLILYEVHSRLYSLNRVIYVLLFGI